MALIVSTRRRRSNWGKPPQTSANALLGSLGLGDHALKLPDQLSGGRGQRVAVARQILHDLVDKAGETGVAVPPRRRHRRPRHDGAIVSDERLGH
jgi:ABC-type arginine transport system ATPase subunit